MTSVIVAGDPLNGFDIIGPFSVGSEAVEYADSHSFDDTNWWVTDLTSPEQQRSYEQQWVDTTDQANPRVLTFDEVEELLLDGTLRT